ncbi:MAG: hypothetical protein P1V20_07135 [Verrucomicrobiales bacterium]|nr:hypothetical protein [Verrucomicrobiales bacterium]
MKKLLAAIVIILVLLGIAGGAAFHYLSKGGGLSLRVSASPPKEPPRGEEDYPQAESSILSVKLDLPISTIEAEANKNVPQDISGVEQKDFHQMIKNGTVCSRCNHITKLGPEPDIPPSDPGCRPGFRSG